MTEPNFSTVLIKEEPQDGIHESIVIKEEIKVEINPYDLGQESDGATEEAEPPNEAEKLSQMSPYYYQHQFYTQNFMRAPPEQAAATPQRNKRKSVPRKVLRQPETPSVPENIVTDEKVTVTSDVKSAEVKRKRIRYEKRFACDLCDKEYSIKAKLTVHKRVHTGERPYGCSNCNKRFRTRATAIMHEHSHLGLKPYACELCDKSYTSNQQLKIHIRSHTGERPYACNICQKDFKDRWKLTLHIQTHTGLKPFECDKCDKKYTTKYQLTTHYRIHTKDKLFECEICTRQFVEKNKLEKHKNIHLGLKPYCCDLCDKRYRQKSHLKFHIENVHMAPASVKAKINKR